MLVVIPSASYLDAEMMSETGCVSHSQIHLGGQLLFQHIRASYQAIDANVEVVLVVDEKLTRDFFPYENAKLKIVGIKDSKSIAETVLAGLESCAHQAHNMVVVHMADTLIGLPELFGPDEVFVESRNDLYRWTSMSEQHGVVHTLHDRAPTTLTHELQTVSVGVFTFSSINVLVNALRLATDSPYLGMDPFFVALTLYSELRPMQLMMPRYWYDFGHVDSYYESKLSYQNLRHFNSLEYDAELGIVTKTSSEVDLFRHQVRWFNQVPDNLRYFCPRIFSSSDGEYPSLTMELMTYPTLTELFVFKRLKLGEWNSVVKVLSLIQDRFSQYSYKTSTAVAMASAMYRDKTRNRLSRFFIQNPKAENYWIGQGDERFSARDFLLRLDDFLEQFGLLDLHQMAPIHGDFCFSNLLYDHRSRMIRMIDPRGEFGVPGIYGDAHYDLAKLFHSVDGCYDFIVTDRFQVKIGSDGQLSLALATDEYHHRVNMLFKSHLLKDDKVTQKVMAIQVLLFMSMLPLHQDQPERQLAMLAVGLKQFAGLMTMECKNDSCCINGG